MPALPTWQETGRPKQGGLYVNGCLPWEGKALPSFCLPCHLRFHLLTQGGGMFFYFVSHVVSELRLCYT